MSGSPTYPELSNCFIVYFHGLLPSPVDMAFQSITGLSASLETEKFQIGGNNSDSIHLPTSVTYNNVTMKRGMKAFPSALAKWCHEAFVNFRFQPIDVVISLIDSNKIPIHNWYLHNVIPKKYEYGELNAESSSIMLETFELEYQYFKVYGV